MAEINRGASSLNSSLHSVYMNLQAFIGALAMAKAASLGMQFNAAVESSTVGIGALLSAQGKFRDAQVRELEGREKINAAIAYSSALVKQLQVDNLKTTATFEQLLNAFQVTLAPGLAHGLSVDQVRQYTVAMVQAAAAMQVPLDMMAEETRSLIEGTITPKNTRIATALGITPEDVKRWQGNADGWFKWVMGKLDAFKQFGGIQANTYGGLLSNVKDVSANILGAATRPFFDDLKAAMQSAYNYAVKVDETTGNITLNPELLNAIQLLNDSLRAALALAQGVAAALIAMGSAYSSVKQAAISVGGSNAGFSGPAPDDLTNNQRLQQVKDVMQEIVAIQEKMANIARGGSGAETLFAPFLAIQNLNLSSATQALENFREQMAKAGQDTTQVDTFLRGLKKTMEESFRNSDLLTEGMSDNMQSLEESFKRSDTLTEGLYGGMTNVAYAVDKAAISAEEFKKKLQEIAGINLDNIGQRLDKSLTGLKAKIQVALAGGKTGSQNAAAEYATTMAAMKVAKDEALRSGTDLLSVMGDIISKEGKAASEKYWSEYLEGVNEANKDARKKSGAGPVDLAKIDQDVLKFKERMGRMYQELHGLDMDYEAARLEASGQFYAAEEVRVNKKVSDQKAAFAKEVADAEQAYTEMQQKLAGKKGSTPEALAAVAGLKDTWEAAKQRAEQYNDTVIRNARQELELTRQRQTLQGNIDLAQTNVTYAQLTGSMEQQLRAQIALIQASREEKLANVNKDIPGLAEAYRQLYGEQERLAQLQLSGSSAQGFAQGIKDATQAKTAFQEAREAGNAFIGDMRNGFQTLFSGIIKGEIRSFEDAWKSACNFMANAFANALSKMASSWIESNLFGGSGGGGSIWSSIGSLFGWGGGSGGSSSSGGFNLNPTIFPYAGGGDFAANKWIMVGEQGPELMKTGSSGSIIPNSRLASASAQAPTVNVYNQTGANISKDQVDWDPYENTVSIWLKAASEDSRVMDMIQTKAKGY
ncbi:MAG: hypothetical protein AB9866_10880 [Syntrophobacteraceae bacterium]